MRIQIIKEEASIVTKLSELNQEASKSYTDTSNKPNNEKVFYGNSKEIKPFGYSDYNEFLTNTESKQRMQGFDKQYLNFVDYIIKITHHIWEDKGIGIIYQTYHNNITMHLGSQSVQGINEVVSGTLQTLHAFPDRKLIGENVIWSGNDQEGFLSSHRISSNATNLGESSFGPATGKKVYFRTIVDCFVHSNRIVEEWLVRDNLHLVQQLGFDPIEIAKKMPNKRPPFQSDFGLSQTMEGQRVPSVYSPQSTKFEIGDFILKMYNLVWEWKLFNHLKDFYADNAVSHYICNKDLIGINQMQGMLVSLFASFPNAKFLIDRVTCNEGIVKDEWEVAVRWRLQGLHEGIGYFEKPSGNTVEILGITHIKVRNEKIVEEWITFDGLDVLTQIHSPKKSEVAATNIEERV